jgi:hypothetical protein
VFEFGPTEGYLMERHEGIACSPTIASNTSYRFPCDFS